ncbi:MAG: hydrogenase iron-sulfur subunit [Methanobacteriaceae archaeon]|jgi:F420-non-reducing hydrogenase iron-sulfur subunit|nr:hydrogenase iron-sulfur subunit [Methanobacteriaceae archaeon]
MSDNIKVVGFCCNWCSYGGADTAGTARMQYPPNVRIIRVMCSGRMNPSMVLKAFKEGADGVFVGGCHMGDCHYSAGNYKWKKRAEMVGDLIEQLGIDRERFIFEWISASEGEKFQKTMESFQDKISKLGPVQRTFKEAQESK